MWRPSFSLILTGVFLGYIVYSVMSLVQLFTTPSCDSDKICIVSYLHRVPGWDLHIFSSTEIKPEPKDVVHIHSTLSFNYTSTFEIPLVLDIPSETRNNGTLFLQTFVIAQNRRYMPSNSFRDLLKEPGKVHIQIPITQYAVPQPEAFNLLGEKQPVKENLQKIEKQAKPVTHLKSKITFTIMTEDARLSFENFPRELVNELKMTPYTSYLPFVKYDCLQSRHRDLVPITESNRTMNLTIFYTPISLGKLRLLLQLDEVLKGFKGLGFSDKDIDESKSIYADTNVYLLCTTVSILAIHLLFDVLALKSEISFWRRKDNLQGLSKTTIVWRAFSQVIIFLYLVDEGSSLLLLVPAGFSTLIEIWKSKKVLRLNRIKITRGPGILPRIQIEKGDTNSNESKTREFDDESMRYLSYLLYPLVIGGAIYSLLYQPHKSWYSWSINSLVNGVYAFGFLFMLPQLFVNYKLKSVAHLPWRSFMYKAFNTFIDDIFAFIITMPTAHRVACFRDDVIFLIYLYQRWLYPVDKSRKDAATITQDPGGSSVSKPDKKKD